MSKKIVHMTDDLMFKKMWGDPNGIRRTEILVSIMLKVPYELIKGNIELIETEKRLKKKKDKRQKNDILAKIKLSKNEKVNLEMNLKKSTGLIDRNITYLAYILSSQLKNKEDYSKIEPVIQFNFNTFFVDKINEPIIDKYYIQNDFNNKLTKKLQINHINIAKCKDICYTKDIEKYSKEEQEIIKICALMCENDMESISKCLGEINMDKELKEEIEETIEEFSENDEIMAHFNSEKDLIAIRNAEMSELREEVTEEVTKQVTEQVTKEVYEKTQLDIAKKMLKDGVDKETIIKFTGIEEEKINELFNEKRNN